MPRIFTPRPLILAGLVIILSVNAVLFGGRLTAWVADGTGQLLAPVSRVVMRARALLVVAAGRSDLAAEHLALEDEVLRLRAQLADQDALKRDVDFYRVASGIRDRTGKDPIRAGIFSYPQAGGADQVIINRGRADWIDVGDVVVTPSGALVGAVTRIFEHHSVVRKVGDVGLEVAVRIVGTDVSGLLRATDSGTIIDLVQKDEAVSEDAVVTTSGVDWYPPGLIVGTVRSVDNDAATLFKIVRLSPAVADHLSGDVIVIRP